MAGRLMVACLCYIAFIASCATSYSILREVPFEFTADLYQKIAQSTDKSIALSPYSVATALSLFSQAVKGNGFYQIANGLHVRPDHNEIADIFEELHRVFVNESNVDLFVANHIYVKEGEKLKEKFYEVATKKFNAGVEAINFGETQSAADHINEWVEENTNGKIHDIIKPNMLSASTELVLLNAIYFKALWALPFDRYNTHTDLFHVNKEMKITNNVEFMYITKTFAYGFVPELNAHALQLKYRDSDMSMIVVLPVEYDGLSALEEKMTQFSVAGVTQYLEEERVEVFLPKFKIEYEVNLNEVLKELGLTDIFSGAADLSGLFEDSKNLAVSDVIHKVFFEVTEEGTEAAAATGLAVERTMFFESSEFRADHPFMYYVVNGAKSNTVLFAGSYKGF